jgi:heme/copper-type cytochrome/quinol oxidase subunit 3
MVWEGDRGEYSFQVYDNFKLRFSLLVFREIILFFSFFWGLFHFSLAPMPFVGHTWPPLGVETIIPRGIPLLNTILLIRRGVTVTWGHHLLMCGLLKERRAAFGSTVILGIVFLLNQGVEFKEAAFSLGERAYGSIFFTLTGFHGFHVFLGLVLLAIGSARLMLKQFTCINHARLEMSIWYWHLVDCVWLVVYRIIYWWGN